MKTCSHDISSTGMSSIKFSLKSNLAMERIFWLNSSLRTFILFPFKIKDINVWMCKALSGISEKLFPDKSKYRSALKCLTEVGNSEILFCDILAHLSWSKLANSTGMLLIWLPETPRNCKFSRLQISSGKNMSCDLSRKSLVNLFKFFICTGRKPSGLSQMHKHIKLFKSPIPVGSIDNWLLSKFNSSKFVKRFISIGGIIKQQEFKYNFLICLQLFSSCGGMTFKGTWLKFTTPFKDSSLSETWTKLSSSIFTDVVQSFRRHYTGHRPAQITTQSMKSHSGISCCKSSGWLLLNQSNNEIIRNLADKIVFFGL